MHLLTDSKVRGAPSRGFVQQGIRPVGCGRNQAVLTQTALPKLFHGFTRLAMTTPSRFCDSSRRVSSRAPMQRLMREICAPTSARLPLGGLAKGGSTNLIEVYEYAQPVRARGLVFMDTPGPKLECARA
ncbi:hypothetical protein LMG28614_06911 [Paraburkholderia ultramafica]|uniref:D-galactarate/Altronate dehydratase C-terminal domain-containing protein n=1 Tax=Paraburkholderia ultramafica TaxID=1544867 RepID=A0A6S7DIF8_9BURK|nr:hypothetical protein LMG28614_06911 [Paraburkholderia ultramafica]